MAMAFNNKRPPVSMSQEDVMRMLALRAGALPQRGQDGAAPADILPNGPELMRSPGGIFGASGLSQSASAAKQVLDSTMQQNARDTAAQPPAPVFNAPMNPRAGMMFRGRQGGIMAPPMQPTGMQPSGDSSPNTGIAGVDSAGPLDLTPQTRFADPGKGGLDDTIHPGFFQHGGLGRKIAGFVGDGLMSYAAAAGDPSAMMELRQRGADRDSQRQLQQWMAENQTRREQAMQDRDYEDNKPRYFAGNEDYRRYDPSTNTTDTLFDAPRPEQEYASQFGKPGSVEYQTALQDYVLKGWGSTAMAARTDLNNDRFQQRLAVKGAPTYGNLHPHAPAPRAPHQPNTSNVVAGILQKGASGQPLNPQEQQIFSSYVNGRRGGHGAANGGAGGAVSEGTVIVNPQTKQRMKMQAGKWVAL